MFDNNVDSSARDVPGSTVSPINCTTVVYAVPEEDRVVVGYINEWINAYSFISSKYTILFSFPSPVSSTPIPSANFLIDAEGVSRLHGSVKKDSTRIDRGKVTSRRDIICDR